jgi:AbrB family looped-hinge helix DNA binding protein
MAPLLVVLRQGAEGVSLDRLFRVASQLLASHRYLDASPSMGEDSPMVTTVTQKNMVTIPAEVGRKLGIKPGWRLDWQPVEGRDEILVRVIPDRGERARRLLGAGRKFSPDREAVAELVAERAAEG